MISQSSFKSKFHIPTDSIQKISSTFSFPFIVFCCLSPADIIVSFIQGVSTVKNLISKLAIHFVSFRFVVLLDKPKKKQTFLRIPFKVVNAISKWMFSLNFAIFFFLLIHKNVMNDAFWIPRIFKGILQCCCIKSNRNGFM